MAKRRAVLLRLDPELHDAIATWAADEMRSTNAQIEFVLRRALADVGRMPERARSARRPGGARLGAAPKARRPARDGPAPST